MLYCFDMDGTLIESYMDREDRDYDRVVFLEGRLEKVAGLLASGHDVAIVTNQGGVAFGYNTEAQAYRKVYGVAVEIESEAAVGRGVDVFVCYGHPDGNPPWNDRSRWRARKPSGEMILMAMALKRATDKSQVLMVGDRPEDEGAAKNAGVAFKWADDFFGGEA